MVLSKEKLLEYSNCIESLSGFEKSDSPRTLNCSISFVFQARALNLFRLPLQTFLHPQKSCPSALALFFYLIDLFSLDTDVTEIVSSDFPLLLTSLLHLYPREACNCDR